MPVNAAAPLSDSAALQSPYLPIDLLGLSDAELRPYLPEGIEVPADIPEKIFAHALQTYLQGRRVDMQILASEVGVSRRTLYRKVSDRNYLLGQIHWYNTRVILAEGLAKSRQLGGAERLVAVYAHFLEAVAQSEPLGQQLRDEPENTLKVITTNQGGVHPKVVAFIERFLRVEREAGRMQDDLPPDALAFAVVRMGESFLYAEALTGDKADYHFSVEMIGRLLHAH